MSFQPAIPGLFSPVQRPTAVPATPKQLAYAAKLAAERGLRCPTTLDRAALSRWIEAHRAQKTVASNHPSSKQVAFAERIARLKRNTVPPECFQDRALMSRWIDSNKPR